MEFYLFRVFTPSGRFHVDVEAADDEAALEIARLAFVRIKPALTDDKFVKAKRRTGSRDERVSVFRIDGLLQVAGSMAYWEASGYSEDEVKAMTRKAMEEVQ